MRWHVALRNSCNILPPQIIIHSRLLQATSLVDRDIKSFRILTGYVILLLLLPLCQCLYIYRRHNKVTEYLYLKIHHWGFANFHLNCTRTLLVRLHIIYRWRRLCKRKIFPSPANRRRLQWVFFNYLLIINSIYADSRLYMNIA